MKTTLIKYTLDYTVGLVKGFSHGFLIPVMLLSLVYLLSGRMDAAAIASLIYLAAVAFFYDYLAQKNGGRWLPGQIFFYLSLPMTCLVILALVS